jgi:hypothetical protein
LFVALLALIFFLFLSAHQSFSDNQDLTPVALHIAVFGLFVLMPNDLALVLSFVYFFLHLIILVLKFINPI